VGTQVNSSHSSSKSCSLIAITRRLNMVEAQQPEVVEGRLLTYMHMIDLPIKRKCAHSGCARVLAHRWSAKRTTRLAMPAIGRGASSQL